MKNSEFKKYLKSLGATFKPGGKHDKVYLNGKQTTIPRHPGAEIPEGTRRAILKQLDINDH